MQRRQLYKNCCAHILLSIRRVEISNVRASCLYIISIIGVCAMRAMSLLCCYCVNHCNFKQGCEDTALRRVCYVSTALCQLKDTASAETATLCQLLT